MGRRGMRWHGNVGTGGREIVGKGKRREGVGN